MVKGLLLSEKICSYFLTHVVVQLLVGRKPEVETITFHEVAIG